MMLSMRPAQRFLVIFLAAASLYTESSSGKVVAITDGDTIKVMHNGQAEGSLNLELVKAGLAWWYAHYAKHDSRLADAEAEARKGRRGLWSDPNPVPPWGGGRVGD